MEVGENLLANSHVELVVVDKELFQKAWVFLVQHQDKTYSLADCAAFILMRERRIQTAFSFDHHFRQAGFAPEP